MSQDTDYALSAKAAGQISAPELPYRPPMPRGRPPKIALIGCGGITVHHLQAYRAMQLDVVAFCDLDASRADQRRADFFPDARVTTDPASLFADPEIGVVDIATHPGERVPLVEAALRAGKHVLSQKPFVLDLDTGARLSDLADACGVRLAVNQNGRWAPHFSYIRNAIRAGLLGEVSTADFIVQWDHNWTAGTPFDAVHHLLMYDFAIHWFDQIATYFDGRKATRVYCAVNRTATQKSKPPLVGHATVEFEGGQATLSLNGDARFGAIDRTSVAGSLGSIQSVGTDLGHQTVTFASGQGVAEVPLAGSWFPDGFAGTMGELLCAVEEGREPENSARNNLQSLAICFAALHSADTGRIVEVGSVRGLSAG